MDNLKEAAFKLVRLFSLKGLSFSEVKSAEDQAFQFRLSKPGSSTGLVRFKFTNENVSVVLAFDRIIEVSLSNSFSFITECSEDNLINSDSCQELMKAYGQAVDNAYSTKPLLTDTRTYVKPEYTNPMFLPGFNNNPMYENEYMYLKKNVTSASPFAKPIVTDLFNNGSDKYPTSNNAFGPAFD